MNQSKIVLMTEPNPKIIIIKVCKVPHVQLINRGVTKIRKHSQLTWKITWVIVTGTVTYFIF